MQTIIFNIFDKSIKTVEVKEIKKYIDVFSGLSEFLYAYLNDGQCELLDEAIDKAYRNNPFFTEENIKIALRSVAGMITKKNLEKWADSYAGLLSAEKARRNVGVIMSGNIPLVGFHDFICTIFSGNNFSGKLSHNDSFLLPAIASVLTGIDKDLERRISFHTDKVKGIDMIIATGSNNTSRYFEYYFGNIPHIFRKNRSSIAVITGNETREELERLGDDMFLYFGLGCRNISKLFLPADYDLHQLVMPLKRFENYGNNNKYINNYDYQRTIMLMNNIRFFDGGFYLLRESSELHAPVAVYYYEHYENIADVFKQVNMISDELQCIAGNETAGENLTPFGETQHPDLWNYADGIDTMEFLLKA